MWDPVGIECGEMGWRKYPIFRLRKHDGRSYFPGVMEEFQVYCGSGDSVGEVVWGWGDGGVGRVGCGGREEQDVGGKILFLVTSCYCWSAGSFRVLAWTLLSLWKRM